MVWEIVIRGIRATGATVEEKWRRFRKSKRTWTKTYEPYPSCRNRQAQWRRAPGLEMTHRAALTFFSQHCPYVAATPKLIPAKLQVPRALCFNDTRNLSKQPHFTRVRAVPGCSAGSDSACLLPGSGSPRFAGGCRELVAFLLPEHPSWCAGQGQKGSWVGLSETGGRRRVCLRVRRGWIHLPAAWHLFSDLCGPFVSPGQGLFIMSTAIVRVLGFTAILESCPQNEIYFQEITKPRQAVILSSSFLVLLFLF